MPWVKSFDVEEAIDQAKLAFWKSGYAGTTINDLLTVTGLARGSLYNAFKGKQALFVAALLKYDRENRRAALSSLEAMSDPREAISALFNGIVTESLEDVDHKGCLLVNTALELPMHDKEVRVIVNAGLRDFESFFQRLLELGQARNEFPDTLSPAATAKALVALVVGMRVLARGAFDEASLRTLAFQAMRLLD